MIGELRPHFRRSSYKLSALLVFSYLDFYSAANENFVLVSVLTVAAVYDRRRSVSAATVSGHRPPLQKTRISRAPALG